MAERSIVVRLRAEVADYKRQMAEAARETNKIPESAARAETALGRMVQSARYNREAWDRAGQTLTAFGTATVAALGASAMAAVQWESDWTGVLKTVDEAEAATYGLEGGLRELARTLPATHSEIAAVAEAAGQLGVATKDVVGFTRVMIDLGETTNLTADEAATAIAQLMNVMQTAPGDVERLASALVALGNNGASTERDIIFMAQRIAGAGAVIGLTEDQVLGLANALASVGIEVEAGGSAISRVLTDMAQDVAAGGVALDTWARVAGVSGARFAEVWQGDPATALTMFIEGLGRMRVAGEDVFGVLADLGQTDVRVSRALLTMATSGDLLADSLDLGARAWEENTALAEEAGKRYDTTAAKVEIARNNITDAAIEFGEVFLPVIVEASEAVAGFAQWVGGLPEPIKATVGVMGGLVGVTSLAAGGFLLLFPRVMDTIAAFRTLHDMNPRLVSGLGRVARAAGTVTAAVAGAVAIGTAIKSIVDSAQGIDRTAAGVEALTNRLADANAVGQIYEATIGDLVESGAAASWAFDDMASAVERVANQNWADRFFGNLGLDADGISDMTRRFEELGQTLAGLADTDLPSAQRLFRAMWEEAGGTAEAGRDLLKIMPAYRDQLYAIATGQGVVLDETTLLNAATGELALVQEGAAGSAEGMVDAYSTLTGATEMITEAQAAWRAEIAEADAAFISLGGAYDTLVERQRAWAEEHAASTEDASDSWETYFDGFSVNLDEYIAELERQVAAQNEWETNMVLLSGRVSQGVLDELARMGPEGAPLVAQLVNASDEQLSRMEELYGQKSTGATDAFAAGLDESAPVIAAAAAQLGEDAAREIAAKLASGTATVQEIMYEYKLQIEGIRPQFQIDTTNAIAELDRFVRDARGRKIYVDVLGRTTQVVSGPGNYVARAGGGPVFGPGTETSDSIPALLSTNEHVWSAAEVKGAGGHAAVAELRALARAGALAPVTTMRFADGGSPGYSGAVSTSVSLPSEGWRISGRLEMGADGLVTLVDGRIAQAQARQTSTARMGVR